MCYLRVESLKALLKLIITHLVYFRKGYTPSWEVYEGTIDPFIWKFFGHAIDSVFEKIKGYQWTFL